MYRVLFTIIISVFVLQGCGLKFLVPPKENPIIEDTIGQNLYRTMATTAERRIVIINNSKDPNYRGLYCAEPSPDSADNLASSLSSYLKAAESSGDKSLSTSGGFDKTLATTVQQLGTRSQGLQLYRDGTYALCQAYMNGILDQPAYIKRLDKLLDISDQLISTELKYKDSIIVAPATQIKSPEQLLEAQRASQIAKLQSKTVLQAERDKTDSAALTAQLGRKTQEQQAMLAAQQAEHALLEEQRKQELAQLDSELELLNKKMEIIEAQKKIDAGSQ
jgi:hypothetical protein